MSLVEGAAHVWMCSCGQHGCIQLADGRVSRTFYSKEFALHLVEQARESEFIDEFEEKYLQDEIYNLEGLFFRQADFLEELEALGVELVDMDEYAEEDEVIEFVDDFTTKSVDVIKAELEFGSDHEDELVN